MLPFSGTYAIFPHQDGVNPWLSSFSKMIQIQTQIVSTWCVILNLIIFHQNYVLIVTQKVTGHKNYIQKTRKVCSRFIKCKPIKGGEMRRYKILIFKFQTTQPKMHLWGVHVVIFFSTAHKNFFVHSQALLVNHTMDFVINKYSKKIL